MTSEIEALKTNEFLRRRKLRIQQVREQSKDIAKKIRQRANVEKFRQLGDIDAAKEREYLQQQDKLVKKLELLYARGLGHVGTSHRDAAAVSQQVSEDNVEKTDLSKQRGKEATAELRRSKQEKLNEKNKLLERKLQARSTANEISREKSSTIASKLSKTSVVRTSEENSKAENIVGPSTDAPKQTSATSLTNGTTDKAEGVTNDMGTQWEYGALPNEWEPHIPVLSLPKDDSAKDSSAKTTDNKSEKSKRPNLFAISDEMPSSLRGALSSVQEEAPANKHALNIVSEYIQNRDLRLREFDTPNVFKKPVGDLQSIKKTIQQTRSLRPEGKRNTNTDKPTKLGTLESALEKKSSVTMYNHNTRDVQDVPYGDRKVVSRDTHSEEDAYSQAMKESSSEVIAKEKDKKQKMQQMRNKIAMSKQDVEKEYKDTMAFLNSLPKDKSKPIRSAYKNEQQQQMHKECRQKKLQMEYNKIQKDCNRLSNMVQNYKTGPKPKTKYDPDDDFNAKDFQYSWMPVPESDGNLAIHTIPTTVKEHKSGNTVKFSKVDSYHEYRSRHKHTPPTKDTPSHGRQKLVESILIEEDENTETSSSEACSVKDTSKDLQEKGKTNADAGDNLSDNERFIIYKILDTKADKDKSNKNAQVLKDIAKSMSFVNKDKPGSSGDAEVADRVDTQRNRRRKCKSAENQDPYDKLPEGVFRTTNTQDTDNIASMYFSDSPREMNGMRREGGDIVPRTQTCCTTCRSDCKSKRKQSTHANQPSTSTSTSSFKTATNDKSTVPEKTFRLVDEATQPADGGFVKFIDHKNDTNSDKFYIGATGFLKDDAYEVVIQLRKKDAKGNLQECLKKVGEKSDDVQIVRTPAKELEVPQKKAYDKKDNSDNVDGNQVAKSVTVVEPEIPYSHTTEDAIKIPPMLSPPKSNANTEQQNETSGQNVLTTDEEIINTTDYNKVHPENKTADKEVLTPFHDSFTIPINVPKEDPVVKSTNSVGIQTQTALDSPPQRPMYLMSSSTSTAYLSPPELLLPQFLKRDRNLSYDEETDFRNMRDPRVRIHNREESSEDYEYQSVCSHVRKMSIRSTRPSFHSEILKTNRERTSARTASSVRESDLCRKKSAYVTSVPRKKCRKCEKLAAQNAEVEVDTQKCVHASKKKSRFLMRRFNSIASSLSRNKPRKTVRIEQDDKIEMNPVLKWYVNRLLALSKEGLQAINIVNQDCSAVSTPGSSIINVPHNIQKAKNPSEVKLSLDHIKESLIQQILEKIEQKQMALHKDETAGDAGMSKSNSKIEKRFATTRKKSLHKVKSLNISRNLFPKTKSSCPISTVQYSMPTSGESSSRDPQSSVKSAMARKMHIRSKSSPSPRRPYNGELDHKKNNSYDTLDETLTKKGTDTSTKTKKVDKAPYLVNHRKSSEIFKITKTTPPKSCEVMVSPSDLEPCDVHRRHGTPVVPLNISTQTSRVIGEEINFMKLAEDKLQNMEKIADLTEKCTLRLSNLAKVLEEVRRNKSLAYSQESEASDSDRASGKYSDIQIPAGTYEPVIEIKEKDFVNPQTETISAPPTTPEEVEEDLPYPTDISESAGDAPDSAKSPKATKKRPKSPINRVSTYRVRSPNIANLEHHNIKTRGKPPPALSRRCLKRSPDYIVPHELSTVIEVDSPQLKNQPERSETKNEVRNKSESKEDSSTKQDNNPDILQSNTKSISQTKILTTESSEDSKIQMMDLKQFNEIMLKPFISIQEYAKQCNVSTLQEGSKTGLEPKDDAITDELSSLHSDGSLPDVIAELLKRNIISEPFKFDTASNKNSTTISSESTLSGLALSKTKKDRKKSSTQFNKENIAESSDSLSISSNPDLENAFKKLGMGWASSTLKKTKERLALSSSSNTSSSSLSQQFKLKSVNNQEFPVLVTDSVSSVQNISTRLPKVLTVDSNRNAEQQTSLTNSMTVRQFLNNELAKRITFTNKSRNDETMEEEFVSLYETKMPEEMKHSPKLLREDRSVDSNPRARTSTPVQIFKSMTYHSSSSSNISNGLFSNADDLSSVKGTSNSLRNHSTSEKDDLTIPNFSLRTRKGLSDCSKSD